MLKNLGIHKTGTLFQIVRLTFSAISEHSGMFGSASVQTREHQNNHYLPHRIMKLFNFNLSVHRKTIDYLELNYLGKPSSWNFYVYAACN